MNDEQKIAALNMRREEELNQLRSEVGWLRDKLAYNVKRLIPQGPPNETVQKVLDVLNLIPRGEVITTIQLSERVGVSYGTIREVTTDPRLAGYRMKIRGTRAVCWTHPDTKAATPYRL